MSTVGEGEIVFAPVAVVAAGAVAAGGLLVLGAGAAVYGAAKAAVWCGKQVHAALQKREAEVRGQMESYRSSLLRKQAALNEALDLAIRSGTALPTPAARQFDIVDLKRQLEQELSARKTVAEVDSFLRDLQTRRPTTSVRQQMVPGVPMPVRPPEEGKYQKEWDEWYQQQLDQMRQVVAETSDELRAWTRETLAAAKERLQREEQGARLNPDLGREMLEALDQARDLLQRAEGQVATAPKEAAALAFQADGILEKAHARAWKALETRQTKLRDRASTAISNLAARLQVTEELFQDMEAIAIPPQPQHRQHHQELGNQLAEIEQSLIQAVSLAELERVEQKAQSAARRMDTLHDEVVADYNHRQQVSAAQKMAEALREMGYESAGGQPLRPTPVGTAWQVDGRQGERSFTVTLSEDFSLQYDVRGFGDLTDPHDPQRCTLEVEEFVRRLREKGFDPKVKGPEAFNYRQAQVVLQVREILKRMGYTEVQVTEQPGTVMIEALHSGWRQLRAVVERDGEGKVQEGQEEQELQAFLEKNASVEEAPVPPERGELHDGEVVPPSVHQPVRH